MLDQYAILPFMAQAKQSLYQSASGPWERSQVYGMNLFRFLEPLLRE